MINCILCGSNDTTQTLIGRKDFEFNVETQLNYYKCNNLKCQLVFAHPMPSIDEIQNFYLKYTTHVSNIKIDKFNFLAKLNQYLNDTYLTRLFKNKERSKIKILDFGCGNGNLLIELKNRGFLNLFGYDFDEKATLLSNDNDFIVFSNLSLVNKYGKYDYIFLNHVVEHLSDAKSIINNLEALLNTSGKIIIRTPNSNSFLSRVFKNNWRGWETPRHLEIFNYNNIELLSDNLKIEKKWTSNIMFSGIFHESIRNSYNINNIFFKLCKHILSYFFYLASIIQNTLFKKYGEEICIIFIKS
jgi:SAM-dependent methyltransferase